jgi:hypothetical protein
MCSSSGVLVGSQTCVLHSIIEFNPQMQAIAAAGQVTVGTTISIQWKTYCDGNRSATCFPGSGNCAYNYVMAVYSTLTNARLYQAYAASTYCPPGNGLNYDNSWHSVVVPPEWLGPVYIQATYASQTSGYMTPLRFNVVRQYLDTHARN